VGFLIVLVALAVHAQIPVQIRSNGVKARRTPSTTASVIATLHKGETFVITDDLPYWYEITLRNGKAAWVRKSSCSVIDKAEPPEEADTPGLDTPAITPPAPAPVGACVPISVPADWNVCPAIGSGGTHAEAYTKKNRVSVPCSYSPITVDEMLALTPLPAAVRALPDTDPRKQYLVAEEAKTVVLDGFLAMAKDGGQEGVNCGSATRLDTHLELVDTDAIDPSQNRSQHVIAEITPWFHEAIPSWSTDDVGKYASYVNVYKASGQKNPPGRIRVSGYLFFDEAHVSGAASWRGTAWEVHPITKIEVFENGVWKEIGGTH
jgi:hypothetical protein